MVAVVLVARVPEKRGADVGISRFTQAAAALQLDIKILPARGGANPFQVSAPDGAHIDIHIFPLNHRTGGRDHGDGVGAQIGFEDRVAAALPVVGGVFPAARVPLPVVAAVLIISSVKRDPSSE
jgi:hypothetical protein